MEGFRGEALVKYELLFKERGVLWGEEEAKVMLWGLMLDVLNDVDGHGKKYVLKDFRG